MTDRMPELETKIFPTGRVIENVRLAYELVRLLYGIRRLIPESVLD
jgi:hypothetical protein